MWDGYFPESTSHVFTFSQLADFIYDSIGPERSVELVTKNKIDYFNIPASFDIEASSWSTGDYESNNVRHYATMYIWQFGLNGSVIYGRTWNQFITLISQLTSAMGLSYKRRLLVYVHNLGYEFQWIRNYFEWVKVFAIKNRRPVYAITGGIEFRCSYFLSNYSLAHIGDELLQHYPVHKLVGALDYKKIRHSSTPLSSTELAYCVNDVKVVMSYIQEKIENDGDITKIPLTNTGYVRNYCREACFSGSENANMPIMPSGDSSESSSSTSVISQLTDSELKKIRLNYHALMKSLQVQSEEEYLQLRRGFMGGFTHAGILYSNQVMYDVGSADLTSSYPYQMVANYFPKTRFVYIGTVNDSYILKKLLSTYCCIFDAEFFNLKPKVEFENILSTSRCWGLEGEKVNNGRVISASHCCTTLTELDFENMCRFYEWSAIKIVNMRTSLRGYLPKDLIMAVLNLYESKTALKGISGKEIEYLVSKNMINAAFGMMVTNIVRGEYAYDSDEGWVKFETDVEKQLGSYNKNFNRFLYYGWGLWVTAHARNCLFSAIYEFGADYVYSDTDSIKGINFSEHADYFRNYNNHVINSLIKMCSTLNIPFSKCAPLTRKGEKKIIGAWDMETPYLRFKAVGAKRYIYEYPDHKLQITVGGLNKSYAVPYLLWKYGNGMRDDNVDMCADWLDWKGIAYDKYVDPFIQLARIAYSNSPLASEALTYILSHCILNYDPIFKIFGEGMYIPPEHTGKQTLDYIDNGFRTICTDYLGVPAIVTERSAIYMEPQNYCMSITDEYRKLLRGVQIVSD